MKRTIRVICLLLFVLSFVVMAHPTWGHAGTFMIGAKSWFAVWDSAIDQELIDLASPVIEQNIIDDTSALSADIETDVNQGYGFIAGPLLGYQSDDGLWSFSGAIMILNSFTQETDGKLYTNEGTYNGKFELELDRSEIDIALTRAIGTNFKVFAGYKYLSLENKFSGDVEGSDYGGDVYKVDITIQIPTIGVGYVYPFSDKLIFGLQFGLLYAMPEVEYKDYLDDGNSGDVDVKNTLGYTGEVNLSYLVTDNLLLQGGYRYQAIRFKTDDPTEDADINEWDRFHGLTISAVYIVE